MKKLNHAMRTKNIILENLKMDELYEDYCEMETGKSYANTKKSKTKTVCYIDRNSKSEDKLLEKNKIYLSGKACRKLKKKIKAKHFDQSIDSAYQKLEQLEQRIDTISSEFFNRKYEVGDMVNILPRIEEKGELANPNGRPGIVMGIYGDEIKIVFTTTSENVSLKDANFYKIHPVCDSRSKRHQVAKCKLVSVPLHRIGSKFGSVPEMDIQVLRKRLSIISENEGSEFCS